MTAQEPLPPLTDDQVSRVAALLRLGRAGAEHMEPTPARDFTTATSIARLTQYALTVTPEEVDAQLARAYGPGRVPGTNARAQSQTGRFCSIAGCSRPHDARGWCRMHYVRWWRHGDPLWTPPPRRIPTAAEIRDEMERALDAARREVGE